MANRIRKTLSLLACSGLLQLLVVQAAWSQDAPDSSPSQQSIDAPPRPRAYRSPRPQNNYRRGYAPDPSARVARMPPENSVPPEQIEGAPQFIGAPLPHSDSPLPHSDSSMYDVADPKYGGPPPNYFAQGCGAPCNDGCGCGSSSGCYGPLYMRGEYLVWWLKGAGSPPLVTTSPDTTARNVAGVLGEDGTTVLVGNDAFGTASRSGGRLVLGWWLDPTMRVEADGFALATARASGELASADGSTILARPFFNLGTGVQASDVVSFPAQNTGSINLSASSSFAGAGLHATQNMAGANFCCDRSYRVDFLYGYRYLRLKERLAVDSSSTSIDQVGPIPGTNFASSDSFATSNNFNGFELGVMAESRLSHWCLTTIGRLGLGSTSEHVTINGSSTVTVPDGTSVTSPGGLLAMPSNIGSYRRSAFAVVPQLELKLAYDLSCNLRFTIGYDLMYWSRVVRPGDQIDLFVNTSQASGGTLTGTPGPLFAFRESDLWVQGLSVGGEFRF